MFLGCCWVELDVHVIQDFITDFYELWISSYLFDLKVTFVVYPEDIVNCFHDCFLLCVWNILDCSEVNIHADCCQKR